MEILEPIRKFFSYLSGKKSEVQAMDMKDVVMANAILEIHRKRSHKEITLVPLHSIQAIHKLDRETAIQAVAERSATLKNYRSKLLVDRQITCERMAELMPSVSWIKIVQSAPDEYLSFEGNGRLAAMKDVFGPADEMMIEVELYRFENPLPILAKLNRVRKMNHLLGQ